MARGRQFSRPVGVRAQRRESLWLFFTGARTGMSAAGGTIVYQLNAAALALRPFTVVRTHITFMLESDQAAAIEFQAAAFGWCVVSDQASAIGATAGPTPVTDGSSDLFFLYKYMFGDESNLTDRTRPSTQVSVDSKAMRKVTDSEDVIGVAEFDSGVSDGLILSTAGRMLVKLH